MKWVFLEKINLIVFSTHPNELFSVAFIWKDLFWRDKEVEHKIVFFILLMLFLNFAWALTSSHENTLYWLCKHLVYKMMHNTIYWIK